MKTIDLFRLCRSFNENGCISKRQINERSRLNEWLMQHGTILNLFQNHISIYAEKRMLYFIFICLKTIGFVIFIFIFVKATVLKREGVFAFPENFFIFVKTL